MINHHASSSKPILRYLFKGFSLCIKAEDRLQAVLMKKQRTSNTIHIVSEFSKIVFILGLFTFKLLNKYLVSERGIKQRRKNIKY